MQGYVPCYEHMLNTVGGISYQYNQMYSLSKGERLFGWDTRNLINITQEAYLFHLIDADITGFFYDISPIDALPFWAQWDLKRMREIQDFTHKIFRTESKNHLDVLLRVEVVFESTSETIWKNQRQASQIRKILLPLD